MPVAFPQVCSVLAHELRSPLSVLQGYIRLLQRQHDSGNGDAAKLEAMLAATGRLAAIAQDASRLGSWLAAPDGPPLAPVPLATLLERIDRQGSAAVTLRVHHAATAASDIEADVDALASAIVAVAESLARTDGAAAIDISLLDEPAGVRLHSRTIDGTAPARGSDRPFAFDAGGMGLALVTASYVLDAHGASLQAGTAGTIDIHFRAPGGPL